MKAYNNIINTVWISPQILKWDLIITFETMADAEIIIRPYKILEHALELLKKEKGEFFRADAISTMKRALDVRLKNINRIHNFTKLFPQNKIHLIEALEICGILRPLMLRQLLKIRNLVEHEDRKPPNGHRCSEFGEYVWYFLKSTDKLVSSPLSTIEFYDPNSLHFEYDVQFTKNSNWDFELCGWFRRSHISQQEIKGWLCCRTNDSLIYSEFIKKNPSWETEGQFKYPISDIWINADFSINMENDFHRKFIQRFVAHS